MPSECCVSRLIFGEFEVHVIRAKKEEERMGCSGEFIAGVESLTRRIAWNMHQVRLLDNDELINMARIHIIVLPLSSLLYMHGRHTRQLT